MNTVAHEDETIRRTRVWHAASSEPGQVPVSKISGVPWWPKGMKRPRCTHNHRMTFLWQVALADVPGLEDDGGLVSFHYCLRCSDAGRTSFGWAVPEVRSYEVTVFSPADHPEVDDWGTIEPPVIDAFTALRYYDLDEAGVFLPQEGGEAATPNDEEFEPVNANDILTVINEKRSGRFHYAVTKLGGWPSWRYEREWPRCPHDKDMVFVGQLDYFCCERTPWCSGGFAYLFVCPSTCPDRAGEISIQAT